MPEQGPARSLIEAMFQAALDAAEPARVVEAAIVEPETGLSEETSRVIVVAIGKAAERMALGAAQALGERLDSGYVVTKDGHLGGLLDERFQTWEAAHPVPDLRGVRATTAVLEAVRDLGTNDVVLALISGGGSALFEAPRPSLTLDDIAAVTRELLRAGAPIQDINAVRIPLSQVKGGGLRRQIRAGRVVTLILSDVLSNDPQFIASGPTVPGDATAGRALELLQRYGVVEAVPAAVVDFLSHSACDDPVDTSADVVRIVADNASAVEAAFAFAADRGLRARVVWNQVEGEARDLGAAWVELLSEEKDADVLIGGGEATVTVRGDGNGGRNTEFALAAAIELDRRSIDDWTVASLATDGQDALTGAAGAIVDAAAIQRARSLGLDIEKALETNDSATLLSEVGALVTPGPTGTNVNDLYFAVRNDASVWP